MTNRIAGSRGLRYATIIALVAMLVGGVYVLSSQGNNGTIIGYFTEYRSVRSTRSSRGLPM
jgi:phospholipid/cholesterol/gamma-HCH transport system substrate-binding protein